MNPLQVAEDLAGSKMYRLCDYERLTVPVKSALGGTAFWRDFEDAEARAFVDSLMLRGYVTITTT